MKEFTSAEGTHENKKPMWTKDELCALTDALQEAAEKEVEKLPWHRVYKNGLMENLGSAITDAFARVWHHYKANGAAETEASDA